MGRGLVRDVQQYCPTVREVVTLSVLGEVEGGLIRGTVVRCNLGCKRRGGDEFCWVGRVIWTRLR